MRIYVFIAYLLRRLVPYSRQTGAPPVIFRWLLFDERTQTISPVTSSELL